MALNLLNLVLFQSLAKAQNKEPSPALTIAAAILPGGLMGVAIPLIAAPSVKPSEENVQAFTEVPSVVGIEVDRAEKAIEVNNLVAKVTRQYHQQKAVHTVFKQDPSGGEQVAIGSEVEIWVSNGARQQPGTAITGQKSAGISYGLTKQVSDSQLVINAAGESTL